MVQRTFSLFVALILFLPAVLVRINPQDSSIVPLAGLSPEKEQQALPGSQVMFIENAGQFGLDAGSGPRFQVRGANQTIWVGEDGLWVTVMDGRRQTMDDRHDRSSVIRRLSSSKGVHIRLSFSGANPHPVIEPFNRLETHVSYFSGRDPHNWHANVPVWGGVRYVDLYPGIDLELSAEAGQLVEHLVVHPGADPGAVHLRVEGVDMATLDGPALRLATAVGEFHLPLPTLEGPAQSYQPEIISLRPTAFEVVAPFVASGTGQMTAPSERENASSRFFNLPPSLLLYSTFLGGVESEYGSDIAVDAIGGAYVVGKTWSPSFPGMPGVFDATSGETFVLKLNPFGSALEYATFLDAGSGTAIAVDPFGAAYINGDTCSAEFPVTEGAFDTTISGCDAFIAKLDSTGSSLVFATLLGGSQGENGQGIALDRSGSSYVTGWVWSPDFPVTPGAFDTVCGTDGNCNSTADYEVRDIFVAKLSPDGSSLNYATFVGGEGDDFSYAIAVDRLGAAYVTGDTVSPDFPTSPTAPGTGLVLGPDAFVANLNAQGTDLEYATILGGSAGMGFGWDTGAGIAVNAEGEAYVTGDTFSGDFPTTPGAFDQTCGTDGNCDQEGYSYYSDVFVVKLNRTGTDLEYATFLGGSKSDYGHDIAIDASGSAYLTGATYSPDFPTSSGCYDPILNGDEDAFVVKLDPSGSNLLYATLLGGSSDEESSKIAINHLGFTYITGYTWSADFPVTVLAFDPSFNAGLNTFDAYVTRLWILPEVPLPGVFQR